MHVAQIILIEATSPEEAFSLVASKLSDHEPLWSDWHNADNPRTMNFAGRWTGEFFGKVDENGEVIDRENVPNFLCYSDDPALAETTITNALENRMNNIREYKAKAIDLASYDYDPYTTKFDMELWATKKLAQILNDEWSCDSGIYDLEDWTASLVGFTKRVATNPTQQYLIPVDFHFQTLRHAEK